MAQKKEKRTLWSDQEHEKASLRKDRKKKKPFTTSRGMKEHSAKGWSIIIQDYYKGGDFTRANAEGSRITKTESILFYLYRIRTKRRSQSLKPYLEL